MLITLIMNVVLGSVSIIVVISRFFHSIVDHDFSVVCYSRYEREEAFMALNLGVTSCQSLEMRITAKSVKKRYYICPFKKIGLICYSCFM